MLKRRKTSKVTVITKYVDDITEHFVAVVPGSVSKADRGKFREAGVNEDAEEGRNDDRFGGTTYFFREVKITSIQKLLTGKTHLLNMDDNN